MFQRVRAADFQANVCWCRTGPFLTGMATFWLQCPAAQRRPDEHQMSLSIFSELLLSVFSLCCSAENNTPLFISNWKSLSVYQIYLKPDQLCTDSELSNEIHVMGFCLSGGCKSLVFFVCVFFVKGYYLSVNGRSGMLGVFTRKGANSTHWYISGTGAKANPGKAFQVCLRRK